MTKTKDKKGKIQPRPPDILRKSGAHKDKSKYTRKKKHERSIPE